MAVALLPVAHVCEPYAVAPAAPALAHRPVAVESAPLAEVQVTGLTGDYVQGPYPATLEGAVRSGLAAADACFVT